MLRCYSEATQSSFQGTSQTDNKTSSTPQFDSSTDESHHDLGEEESTEEAEEEINEDQIRINILNAALPFVHAYGWSSEAISNGNHYSVFFNSNYDKDH